MSIIEKIISYASNPADMVLRGTGVGSLWVGGRNVTDDFLFDKNISTVISLCHIDRKLPSHIKHYRIDIKDSSDFDNQYRMIRLIPGLLSIIHLSRLSGHNVLVHCRAGMQRAPTVVAMYLHKYYYNDIIHAISKVKKVRPIAFCNGYTFRQVLGRPAPGL
jgi:protein tyrosine phosphatase